MSGRAPLDVAPSTRRDVTAGIDAFSRRFGGRVVLPGDADYDEARSVWNGMIDRRPAVIARCATQGDVAVAIAFARDAGLPLAVRGGGHNVAGYATCDGGVVIDLSSMRDVDVDPLARVVHVGGGATWADVDQATQPYGLAVPGGEVSETGVAGLTLSGGVGMLRRKYGLSCDNLLAAEVVLADGRFVRASFDENPDLFWALRGGGGNFGVVTRFTFQAHPAGPEVAKLGVLYPIEAAAEVLRAWRAFTQVAPDEATTAANVWRVPAIPDLPSELHGRATVMLEGMYSGDIEDGLRLFRPLQRLGEPLLDLTGPMSYLESQSGFDALVPAGLRYYWKALNLASFSDEVIAGVIDGAQRVPEGQSLMVIRHLGGAISRVPANATAFGNRSAPYNLSLDAIWEDPSEDDAHVSWVRGFWNAMRAHASGVYLNFPGFGEEGEALVRAGLGGNYVRLQQVKRRYDPANVFRLNQNVKPAAAE